jgi:hypothetical protein
MIKEESSVQGLYAGFTAKFFHTVMQNACMMVLYEKIREQTK